MYLCWLTLLVGTFRRLIPCGAGGPDHFLLLFLFCAYSGFNPRLFFISLEDLGDANIALGPHLEEKTCDRLKTIIRLQDLLVLQGTTKSTRKKSQVFISSLTFRSSSYFVDAPMSCASNLPVRNYFQQMAMFPSQYMAVPSPSFFTRFFDNVCCFCFNSYVKEDIGDFWLW